MTEPATRSTERTRRAILDAAMGALRERGTGAAIGLIAEQAGVSKGGLLHHFPSRDILMVAVAEDALESLRDRVGALVDLSENHPGKLLRAYVRALFERGEEVRANFDHIGVWSTLTSVPGVEALLEADSRYWREALAQDGLHEDRITIVRHTAEGVIINQYQDQEIDPRFLEHTREMLFAITNSNGPLEF